MQHQEIFVGREKQLQDFENSLQNILEKDSFFSFGKRKISLDLPKIFLFYGEGGLGKTTLCHKFIEIGNKYILQHIGLRKVILDWDDYEHQYTTIDSQNVMDRLIENLSNHYPDLQSYFKPYHKTQRQIHKVTQKIASLRKQYMSQQNRESGVKLFRKGADIAMAFAPLPIFVKNWVMEKADTLEGEVRTWIWNEKKLTEVEIEMYQQTSWVLTKSLVNCLKNILQQFPIILFFDTYERIDNTEVELWLRDVFLKNLYLHTSNLPLLFVLSGRNNHYQAYRESLTDKLLYDLDFDDILLIERDLQQFAQKSNLSLNLSEIQQLKSRTQGVPIAVKDVFDYLKKGVPFFDLMTEETKNRKLTENIGDIVGKIVYRFLKYCTDDATKFQVYHLAMLREIDIKLLANLWNRDFQGVRDTLHSLGRQHSFIRLEVVTGQNRRSHWMHALVREFLRKDLLRQYKRNRNMNLLKPELEIIGKEISKYYLLKKQEIVEDYEFSEYGDLYHDEEYIECLLNYFNALVWEGQKALLKVLPSILLECLVFNQKLGKQILETLEPIEAVLKGKYRNIYLIFKLGWGKFQPLSQANFDEKPNEQETALFDYFLQQKNLFSGLQQELLTYWKGQLLCRKGKLEEAFRQFQSLGTELKKSIKENLASFYFQIAYKAHDLNKIQLAVNTYTSCIELNPIDISAYNNRGGAYFDLQNYEKAIKDYSKALLLNPSDAVIYNNRGLVYSKICKFEYAIEDFNKSIEIAPKYVNAYINRGSVYCDDIEDYLKAIKDFDKAIELNPDEINAYYNRGNAYSSVGKFYSAIDDYHTTIKINNRHLDAYFNIGIAYEDIKDYHKAIEYYTKLINLSPNHLGAIGNISWNYYLLSNYTKSIEFSQKALSIDPNQLWIQCNLALATLHTGKVKAAQEYYQRAIKLVENTEEFEEIIADLHKALKKNSTLEGGKEILKWLQQKYALR